MNVVYQHNTFHKQMIVKLHVASPFHIAKGAEPIV